LGRLLFFLLLALIIWWVVRGLLKRGRADGAKTPPTEDMVACARCGVNMPKSEARAESGRYFCVNNPHCTP
jgi:uncharacterized protein